MLLTASQLKDACGEMPFIYRAGAWKPRTSPHTFQGAGNQALEWLQEVKRTYGVPVATEVATPEHVQAAIQAGIDYLWIGARTSANPLAVQAIADTIGDRRWENGECRLKGVLIKNPVNADAALWLGNIERLEKTGVPVIAVHRGCNHQPCWSMAHQVRTARPDIAMLLDPSHISGGAAQVPALMDKIAELGLDGAMIEVHCDPKAALSDSAQQITPKELRDTLDSILSRFSLVSLICPPDGVELNWLRAEIDELDEALLETVARRMEVSQRIGTWKKAHGVSPLQPERYQQLLERLKAKGEGRKGTALPAEFVEQLWNSIHEQSLREQE